MKSNDFINHLLANVNVDNARVIEFVNSFTDGNVDATMRIMSYLTKFCDAPKVSKTSDIAKDARLVSYNFFTNRVDYRYIHEGNVRIQKDHVDDVNTSMVYESRDDIPHKDWSSEGVLVSLKYWNTNHCDLDKWET